MAHHLQTILAYLQLGFDPGGTNMSGFHRRWARDLAFEIHPKNYKEEET